MERVQRADTCNFEGVCDVAPVARDSADGEALAASMVTVN